jgi:hypothetical protein
MTSAAVFLVHMARRTSRQERLAADWPRAQATVTGARAGWTSGAGNTTRNRRFFPLYRFSDAHGMSYTGESEISFAEQPVLGSRLDVAYNPAKPAESFPVSSQSRATLGCLIAFFAVFSLVCLWFISVFPLP